VCAPRPGCRTPVGERVPGGVQGVGFDAGGEHVTDAGNPVESIGVEEGLEVFDGDGHLLLAVLGEAKPAERIGPGPRAHRQRHVPPTISSTIT
jgi:hypothetical protein